MNPHSTDQDDLRWGLQDLQCTVRLAKHWNRNNHLSTSADTLGGALDRSRANYVVCRSMQ